MEKEKIKAKIESGEINPLEVYAELEEQINELTEALDYIYEYVNIEAQETLSSGEPVEIEGILFQLKKGRKLWDYKNCKNHVEAKMTLKETEKILQAQYELSVKGKLEGKHELPTMRYAKSSIKYEFLED